MDKNNIFSIITVSYNQGKFIEETIKSVIFQEGDFFIEYLIVDGGSTDGTIEILKRYKRMIENKEIEIRCRGIDFKYISEKDEGPTNALNKGLRMIGGEIVGIINSDDKYYNDALKRVWTTFQKNKEVDIVYGDVELIDEEGNFIGFRKGKRKLELKDFYFENAIVQPEAFIRKRVFERVGLFDEDFGFTNDYEFWIRCMKNKINFKYIPYTCAIFRKRKDARSSSLNPLIFIDTLRVQLKHFNHLKNFFLRNLGVYSAMHSYWRGEDFETGFERIFNLLPDGIILDRKKIKRAKSYGYLKFAIYKIFENRKESIKSYLKSLKNNPFIFFSRDNLIFVLRLITRKKEVYFKLKKIFLRKN